jgi:hypothetical protein
MKVIEHAQSVEKESYKYNTWCCTINSNDDGSNLDATDLQKFLKDNCEEWVCQKEMESRIHWQCVFKLHTRTRKSTLLSKIANYLSEDLAISQVTVLRCIDWEKAKKYCSDPHKRLCGTELLMFPAIYSEGDIVFLDDINNRYEWQNTLLSNLLEQSESGFTKPDDRTVYWIYDEWGNSGKSKFVKWLFCRYPGVTKLAFGSSTQLRSAICNEGPQLVYFIDFPRTLGSEDSINTVLSVIEDLKNGFVRSNMYGESKTLLMEPPHIICFSNDRTPLSKLSVDRWIQYRLKVDKSMQLC